uniref:Uncharacterized protein n=1 Tax=Sphaerodactylus townsendi TaxID=933632 RepID=A0ACB8FF36_9SAUR
MGLGSMPFYEELRQMLGGTGRSTPRDQLRWRQSACRDRFLRQTRSREGIPPALGSRDLETIGHETPAGFHPIPYIPGNSPEDDATQIPMSQMSALFADTSGDMNDVLDHPIAGSSGANEAANLSGDAAEVTYPTLAEDTDLESCVGATAPLPSQVEELMMVGETSELCCTQVACQESQPMHKRLRKSKARMDL